MASGLPRGTVDGTELYHEAIANIEQLRREKAVLLEAVKHALAVEMSTTQQQEKELREGYVELLRSAIDTAEGRESKTAREPVSL